MKTNKLYEMYKSVKETFIKLEGLWWGLLIILTFPVTLITCAILANNAK